MTSHINEKCTLVSNHKKVMVDQQKIHTTYTDGDFLRLFNDHFDTNIKGKVIQCDIELYNIDEADDSTTVYEIELIVRGQYAFYVLKYRTNFEWFVDPFYAKYTVEETTDY